MITALAAAGEADAATLQAAKQKLGTTRIEFMNGYAMQPHVANRMRRLAGTYAGTISPGETGTGTYSQAQHQEALDKILEFADRDLDEIITTEESMIAAHNVQKWIKEEQNKEEEPAETTEEEYTLPTSQDGKAPALTINRNTNHYSVVKSRAEGEKDLYDLVQTGEVEEAWACIEYKDGKTIWYEAGTDETEETASMDLDGKRIFKNQQDIETVTLYHFHPNSLAKGQGRKINFIDAETPSYRDMTGNWKVIGWLKNMYPNLLDKTDFRIVVGSGIYNIRLNPRALQNDKMWSIAAKKMTELDHTRLFTGWQDTGFDYYKWNSDSFASENSKFAARFSNPAFRITFQEKGTPAVSARQARHETRPAQQHAMPKTTYQHPVSKSWSDARKEQIRQGLKRQEQMRRRASKKSIGRWKKLHYDYSKKSKR